MYEKCRSNFLGHVCAFGLMNSKINRRLHFLHSMDATSALLAQRYERLLTILHQYFPALPHELRQQIQQISDPPFPVISQAPQAGELDSNYFSQFAENSVALGTANQQQDTIPQVGMGMRFLDFQGLEELGFTGLPHTHTQMTKQKIFQEKATKPEMSSRAEIKENNKNKKGCRIHQCFLIYLYSEWNECLQHRPNFLLSGSEYWKVTHPFTFYLRTISVGWFALSSTLNSVCSRMYWIANRSASSKI
jgi:hypothetical protein